MVFTMLFLIIENRAAQPMVEPSLFRNRTLAAAGMSASISFISMFSVMLLMPYYLENVKGYSPAEVGIILISIPLVMSLVAPASGWIADKTGSNLLSTIGIGISCVSLFILSYLDKLSTPFEITASLALFGFGMGLFQPPNSSIIMSSVPRERLGIAAGTMATMRNLGMVMGVAIGGAVFTNRFVFHNSFVPAFQDTYLITALICCTGIITSITRGSKIKREEIR
ncbi:Putative multidrug resistance protein MdtD [uncultured archaeon]|nr:Putative multidrug resistance protein MdtD [uncultured archaeon]